jgi:hypothetical protein
MLLLPILLDPFYLVTRWCMRRQLLPDEPLPLGEAFTLQMIDVQSVRDGLVTPGKERVS